MIIDWAQGNNNSFANLALGGYDESLLQTHNVTFDLMVPSERDLSVGLQSITIGNTTTQLLPDPILTFIDAGVSHIWLPITACEAFQKQFNLTWDPDLELYLVSDTVRRKLLAQNVNITFTLLNDVQPSSASPKVTIVLPYSAFDLQLTAAYPGVANSSRYFPIRQAANATQYTLGRAFLQHAYVIADYERNQFSVHQTLFPASAEPQLRAILPPASDATATGPAAVTSTASPGSSPPSGGLPLGVIVAIAVAASVFVVVVSFAAVLWRRRAKRRSMARGGASDDTKHFPWETHEAAEIDGKDSLRPELKPPRAVEADAMPKRTPENTSELQAYNNFLSRCSVREEPSELHGDDNLYELDVQSEYTATSGHSGRKQPDTSNGRA